MQDTPDAYYHTLVSGEDIAEDIVWTASRPPHVNIAEVLVLPTNQASVSLNYRAPKL
jgi:3-hydroxy acid dehydrogenase/malonic semialdehyde reductase